MLLLLLQPISPTPVASLTEFKPELKDVKPSVDEELKVLSAAITELRQPGVFLLTKN